METEDDDDYFQKTPPKPTKKKTDITRLQDTRFVNIIHKESGATRRIPPGQLSRMRESGWDIDFSIHT